VVWTTAQISDSSGLDNCTNQRQQWPWQQHKLATAVALATAQISDSSGLDNSTIQSQQWP
jgi:hypothetical protein